MSDEKVTEFEVIFEAKGVSTGKMRNELELTWVKEGEENEVFYQATDEGPFHGGDDTAPPPLAFFSTGLVGCLMTQVRAFSKRLNVPIRGVEIKGRLHWAGRQVGRDPYVTRPVGFSMDIELDSDAPEADQIRLIEAAKQGCFVEQTLSQINEIPHRLKRPQGWIDV